MMLMDLCPDELEEMASSRLYIMNLSTQRAVGYGNVSQTDHSGSNHFSNPQITYIMPSWV